MIKVILRFDDPSATSNHLLERQIIECLESKNAKATFAVIPFKRQDKEHDYSDTSWANHLVKGQLSGITEIALHGYSHEKRGLTPQDSPTEFSGVDADTQEEMIREGADHLRAIFGKNSISGFIPPWNSYDANTLQALENQRIRYISAGAIYSGKYKTSMMHLPRTCQFIDIKGAVVEARRYAKLEPTVIAVMHHYDFIEDGTKTARLSLSGFSELLAWISAQSDLSFHTLGDLADTDTPQTNIRNVHWQPYIEKLPWRIKKYLPKKCLIDAPLWRIFLAGINMANSELRHVSG